MRAKNIFIVSLLALSSNISLAATTDCIQLAVDGTVNCTSPVIERWANGTPSFARELSSILKDVKIYAAEDTVTNFYKWNIPYSIKYSDYFLKYTNFIVFENGLEINRFTNSNTMLETIK